MIFRFVFKLWSRLSVELAHSCLNMARKFHCIHIYIYERRTELCMRLCLHLCTGLICPSCPPSAATCCSAAAIRTRWPWHMHMTTETSLPSVHVSILVALRWPFESHAWDCIDSTRPRQADEHDRGCNASCTIGVPKTPSQPFTSPSVLQKRGACAVP